jgi:hypothetical protein
MGRLLGQASDSLREPSRIAKQPSAASGVPIDTHDHRVQGGDSRRGRRRN